MSITKPRCNPKGFTLMELIVSMTIFALMSSVILLDYPQSIIRLNLSNLTHKVALILREAQIRGSSVDSKKNVVAGYGLYISRDDDTKAIYFNDYAILDEYHLSNGVYVGDGLYATSTTPTEDVSVVSLGKGYVFDKICVGSGYPFICNNDNTDGIPTIDSLTISFKRPRSNANIYINNSIPSNLGGACIEMHSPKYPMTGHMRSVRVFYSGMITTSNMGCQ